jgi:hypothetical protein
MLVARVVSEVWSAAPEEHYSLPTAAPIYSSRIVERGFVKRSGRPNLQLASACLLEFCNSLRRTPDSLPLPSNETDAHRWLSRLLQSPRSGIHPLRHAVTIAWLFGSFECFSQRYRDVSADQAEHGQIDRQTVGDCVVATSANAASRPFLKLVKGGMSVRRASMEAGERRRN